MIWYGPAKNNGLETCSAVALRASAAGCGCGTSQRTNLGQGERTWLRDVASTTNSTARGGGGSFKNRKPIGAVGCCEPQMAE